MSRITKIWLIIAASLVIIGLIIFLLIMAQYNWDFSKLGTTKYQTNTHNISKDFNSISMATDTADINFALSDDDNCSVECYEESKAKHSVVVNENTLSIKLVSKKAWYDYVGINFDSPKITVYLPEREYISLFIKSSTSDIKIPKDFKFKNIDISTSTGMVANYASVLDLLKIKTSTGAIETKNISAKAIDLSVSTGSVTISDAECDGDIKINVSTGNTNITNTRSKNIISNGSTGDILLKNVIATKRFNIERSTGDVRFDGADADEIIVTTDTGDVTGSLLSDKVFITQTDTGRVDVPKTIIGGRCEITTDTGDIKITTVN